MQDEWSAPRGQRDVERIKPLGAATITYLSVPCKEAFPTRLPNAVTLLCRRATSACHLGSTNKIVTSRPRLPWFWI